MMDRMTGTLPKGEARAVACARLITALGRFKPDANLEFEAREKKPKRSDQQNRLLFALYTDIIEKGGEAMRGWTKDDLHEFFLSTHFGTEVVEMFGKKRQRPLRRSSKLNKHEFADFIDSVVRFMAQQGVYLDLPGDL